jgi:hypothetical protein
MTVAVVMDFEGVTLGQYDQTMEIMGLEGNPEGALFHWVTATDDGIRVVDVWESREQFEAFAANTIGPATAQVGIGGPPSMTFHDVHNHLPKAD